MEVAGEELSGVVPLRVMGVEPRTADEAIELGRVTAEVGLDGMQLYSLDMGHGYRPRPEELEAYPRHRPRRHRLPGRDLHPPVGLATTTRSSCSTASSSVTATSAAST